MRAYPPSYAMESQEKKRSFFVVVGDRQKDVIVHLHYIMSSVDIKQNKIGALGLQEGSHWFQ